MQSHEYIDILSNFLQNFDRMEKGSLCAAFFHWRGKRNQIYRDFTARPRSAAFSDRAVLWNAVEKIEKAKNAQLAREIELALPRELTREQGISLVREYVKAQFVAEGMCADICVHDTGGGNPHAHVMLTMRPPLRKTASGREAEKGGTFLTSRATKSMTEKSGSTNANPYPLPTGTTRPKPRNGGRHGRKSAISI